MNNFPLSIKRYFNNRVNDVFEHRGWLNSLKWIQTFVNPTLNQHGIFECVWSCKQWNYWVKNWFKHLYLELNELISIVSVRVYFTIGSEFLRFFVNRAEYLRFQFIFSLLFYCIFRFCITNVYCIVLKRRNQQGSRKYSSQLTNTIL